MTTVIAAVVAVWLIKGLLEALKGLLQIALGLFCGIVGLLLSTSALVLDALGHLWATAFPAK